MVPVREVEPALRRRPASVRRSAAPGRTGARRRLGALLAVMLLAAAGCAPSARTPEAALGEGARGAVAFTGGGVVVSGVLTLADRPGRVPAVILMHGCSGLPHRAINGWNEVLPAWGYATFVVDGFGPRGYREICTDTSRVRPSERIADAYGALRILATHPRIDPERIILMGFSHGGIVTLAAATRWARERFAPPGAPAFRGFIAFYPFCNVEVPGMTALAGPLRVHSGALDDWTPASHCVSLVRGMREAGGDAEITVYDGAHHSFDSVGLGVVRLSNVDNPGNCLIRLPSIDAPPDLAALRACMTRGATSGWNPEATEAARRNVRAQLEALVR